MNVGIWLTATGQLQQYMATNTNKDLISNIGLALDIMNAVCQVIMAIAAIIAIIITIKQIQLRRKSDLRVSYTCGMGAIDRDDKFQFVEQMKTAVSIVEAAVLFSCHVRGKMWLFSKVVCE